MSEAASASRAARPVVGDAPGGAVSVAGDREAWLERRRHGLGGSDVAAALGISPWRTPLALYLEKRGMVAAQEETEAAHWGSLLEPAIADEYARREGVELVSTPLAELPIARDEWKLATPDRLVRSPTRSRGLEIKAVGLRATWGAEPATRWGDPETDAVPEVYLVQCAWYMHVTDLDRWDVAALIGGQELRIYRLERDPDLEGAIVAGAERFWREHVLAGVAPAPVGADNATTLARLWPRHRGEQLLPAPLELDATAARLAGVRAEIVRLQGEREDLEATLKDAIRDAPGFQGEGWRATWKRARDGERFDALAAIAEHAIAPEVVARYTVPVAGSRRFLFRVEE